MANKAQVLKEFKYALSSSAIQVQKVIGKPGHACGFLVVNVDGIPIALFHKKTTPATAKVLKKLLTPKRYAALFDAKKPPGIYTGNIKNIGTKEEPRVVFNVKKKGGATYTEKSLFKAVKLGHAKFKEPYLTLKDESDASDSLSTRELKRFLSKVADSNNRARIQKMLEQIESDLTDHDPANAAPKSLLMKSMKAAKVRLQELKREGEAGSIAEMMAKQPAQAERRALRDSIDTLNSNLENLRKALIASGNPALQKASNKGLNGLFDSFMVPLRAAMMEGDSAKVDAAYKKTVDFAKSKDGKNLGKMLNFKTLLRDPLVAYRDALRAAA